MTEYERGYRAALRDVEKASETMEPGGNHMLSHPIGPKVGGRLRHHRLAALRLELGSQRLAILRITQTIRGGEQIGGTDAAE